MKKAHWLRLLTFTFVLLVLIGCAPQESGLPMVDLQATAKEIVRQTESVLPTVPPVNTFTPAPVITRSTPTQTPTATSNASPTPSFTATALAHVYMTGDTNCRQGPSTHYGFVTLMQAGQTADIVGRDQSGAYWVIDNPNGEGQCWIWNAFATASGSLDQVRVMNAPPTLTPTRTPTSTPRLLASVRYYQMVTCGGTDAVVVRIYNYSRRDLDSWRAQIFQGPDRTHQITLASDQFASSYDTCEQNLSKISYRSSGYAVIPFDASTAPRFLIEFDVCAHDGKERDCLFTGIYVNSPYYTHTATPTPTPTLTPTPSQTPTSAP